MKHSSIAIILSVMLLLSFPTWSLTDGTVVVRDRSGRVVEKRITRGNRTEIRSPTGKLIRVQIRKRDRIEIRTPSGRLIRIEKAAK